MLEEFEQVEQPRRWRPGGRVVTGFFGLLAGVALLFGVLRLVGVDEYWGSGYLVAALAFTPYVVAGGAAAGVLALLLGRRKLAFVLVCVTLVLASLVSPRLLRNQQPEVFGQTVRVLSANLRLGHADAAEIVRLVRTNNVQVLAMQELTPAEASELDTDGLAELMPYRVYRAEPGGTGSGIAAVYPLRELAPVPNTSFQMPIAVVDLPGNQDAEVVSVHAMPPVQSYSRWRADLHALPPPPSTGRVRFLAGDFNASWDHAALRDIIDRGYRDAAEQLGSGLAGSWSQPGVPPITIDHLLADRRCAMRGYTVFGLTGSDHHAIMVDAQVPDHDLTAPPE